MVTMMAYIFYGKFFGLYGNHDGIYFSGEWLSVYGNNDVYIFFSRIHRLYCNNKGIYFSGGFLGLYGNNDGIKENDLVSRNGDIINSNSSMIDIHHLFGLTCKYIPMLWC